MSSSTAAQSWQYAQQTETQVKALMKNKEFPTYNEIDQALIQLRTACEAVIFADFEYATSVRVEHRLWDIHTMVNSRYRKLMDHHKKGQKNHIERRATAKHYADFIKTSQYFYKGYIQRLASHFNGLEQLYRIAQRLSLSMLTADQRAQTSPEVGKLVQLSCYATLLHLGDLSRYRNGFRNKDRSWEPALGYYALANDFFPAKGHAQAQMAVIALVDGVHLDAVYHLYRALTTKEPHVLAKDNLEIEFKKIISAWEKKVPQQNNDKLGTLCWWFVLLHAKFYQGQEFSTTRRELEKEIFSRLALLLKEQSFGEILEKLVLVSIAAQSFAHERVKESGAAADLNSWTFCLGFNVRMLSTVLHVLLPELEDQSAGEDVSNGLDRPQPERPNEKITAIARRVLPALRQYSSWLISNTKWILALSIPRSPEATATALHIQEMWKNYAIVLTRLVAFFPVAQLVPVDYLLEEDESTVGFEPLRAAELPIGCDLFKAIDGSIKPRSTDRGVERHHPNIEMQSRIRDILVIGLTLHMDSDVPITLDRSNGRNVFLFVEEATSPLRPESSFIPTPTHTSSTFSPRGSVRANHDNNHEDSTGTFDAHRSIDDDMLRMVDDLVEPSSTGRRNLSDETSYGMHSLTANEIFAPIGSNGFDQQIRSTPKMLPSLPGFQNTAFTPQPNELRPTSPNRPSTRGKLSPLSLETKEGRLEAVAALEDMTGYALASNYPWGRQSSQGGSATAYKSFAKQLEEGLDDPMDRLPLNSSWGRQSSRPNSGSLPRPVNQVLQESLTQQYIPMTPGFPDSSSLYANTSPSPARNGVLGSRNGAFGAANGNNSTTYAGASDFDRDTMLRSSIWNGSQAFGGYTQTPPGGQGD